jgi:uncharacterized membrane protein (UPF0127 family)
MRRVTLAGSDGFRMEVEVAERTTERMRGLLRRSPPPPGHGLLIPNARSVHSLGMRFSIDVSFLDAELTVLDVTRLAPGRVLVPRRLARHILECAPGAGPEPGQHLRVVE